MGGGGGGTIAGRGLTGAPPTQSSLEAEPGEERPESTDFLKVPAAAPAPAPPAAAAVVPSSEAPPAPAPAAASWLRMEGG